MVMDVLERLLCVGVKDDLDLTEVRRIRLCNMCALIGGFTNFLVTFSLFIACLPAFKVMAIPNLINSTLLLSSIAWNAYGKYSFARIWLMTLVHVQILIVTFLLGRPTGFQAYLFIFPPVTLLLLPRPKESVARWTLSVLSAILYLLVEHHSAWDKLRAGLPESMFPSIHAIASTLTFATLILIIYFFYNDTLRAEEDLAREHERSEGLLRNILPTSIATRLKSEKASIADGFAEVSVLFADLVGFTELSSRLPPAELVELLNRVFSEFDDLCERDGLEKIKTIGDAYMVASGLPVPRPDHAQAIAHFAFDMLDVVDRVNTSTGFSLSVRIGIHTGPVVAGVIGKRKFIYDLWGDTVNIASRMESHGVAGSIHVTAEVARRIGDEFEISDARTILVKGKGEMTTHFLLRPKSAA
jgi:class 3 adenylate cyclase